MRRSLLPLLAILLLTHLVGAVAQRSLETAPDEFDATVTLVTRGSIMLPTGLELLGEAVGITVFTKDVPEVPLTYDFEGPRSFRDTLRILLNLYNLDAYLDGDVLVIGPEDALAPFRAGNETGGDAARLVTRSYVTTLGEAIVEPLGLRFPGADLNYSGVVDTLYVAAPVTLHREIQAEIRDLEIRADEVRADANAVVVEEGGPLVRVYDLPGDAGDLVALVEGVAEGVAAEALEEIGLLRITMPEEAQQAVEATLARARDLHARSTPSRVTYSINNAVASELQPNLQEALDARELSATVIADDRTNTLTAIATTPAHEIIAGILGELDTRERQVRIRVRIHEVSKIEAQRLGLNLGGGFGSLAADIGEAGLALAFNPTGLLHALTLNATLDTLEEQSLARSIDDANVLTLNNETAIFNSGGSIRVLSGGGGEEDGEDGGGQAQEIAFGTLLEMTPRIGNDGRITLELAIELSGFDGEVSGGLRFTERVIENTVQIPDGGVVILAGLVQQSLNVTENGVPILKDIPIIGTFFRHSSERREESEIIVTLEVNLEDPRAPESPL